MDRPRRSTRAPVKAPQLLAGNSDEEPTRRASKRKAPSSPTAKAPGTAKSGGAPKPVAKAKAPVDPEAQLKMLLTSPKSDLVSLDMSDLINAQTWDMLSEAARVELQALLPPTAFIGFKETLGVDHPLLQPLDGERPLEHPPPTSNGTKPEAEDIPQAALQIGNVEPEKPPASPNAMEVDPPSSSEPQPTNAQSVPLKTLSPTFFTDPHLLAALRTFQDHLYLGWFTEAHVERVQKFEEGIRDGKLAALWKDEVWEREHGVPLPPREQESGKEQAKVGQEENGATANEVVAEGAANGLVANGTNALVAAGSKGSFSIPCESNARAGGASEVKLSVLVKKGVIRVGDVIAYRRSFATSELVEKDCVVQSIDKKAFTLTVITIPGRTRNLPAELLMPSSLQPSGKPPSKKTPTSSAKPPSQAASSQPTTGTTSLGTPTLVLTFLSPTQLETALLDADAQIERSRRPNGNAWKSFSVWRWRVPGVPFGEEEDESAGEAAYNPDDARGGRENHGTLFYLRGSYYHDR
ncbi:unnamed protein product [Cyclocybe aegerita]|uniref:ASX DEUBAD domain-containing protein n=1 Tax=Cyclocybe aegerita TaxID=1973307 RepID=A0A8S0WS25_CYCAE|nr:unnamed protein product [Cyclocybe aegerita]